MVHKENKISEETIQLYLMGELSGPLLNRIQSIDNAPNPKTLNTSDSKIKEMIMKLRSVDQMLVDAAETSFHMPAELSSKIEQIVTSESSTIGQRSATNLAAIKAVFSWSNFWSMTSGTALASLGFLALVYLRPEVVQLTMYDRSSDFRSLAEPNILKSINESVGQGFSENSNERLTLMGDAQNDAVTELKSEHAVLPEDYSRVVADLREVQQSMGMMREIIQSTQHDAALFTAQQNFAEIKDANYTVTERLAFRVLISDQTGTLDVLEDGSEVLVDQSFHIDLLPLRNVDLSILYRSNDGATATLLSNETLSVGKPYSFPADLNGHKTWQFNEPEGTDSLVFLTSDAVITLKFSVKK